MGHPRHYEHGRLIDTKTDSVFLAFPELEKYHTKMMAPLKHSLDVVIITSSHRTSPLRTLMDGNLLHHTELIEAAWKHLYVLSHVCEFQQALRLLLGVGVDDVRTVLQTIAEHTVNVDLSHSLYEFFQDAPRADFMRPLDEVPPPVESPFELHINGTFLTLTLASYMSPEQLAQYGMVLCACHVIIDTITIPRPVAWTFRSPLRPLSTTRSALPSPARRTRTPLAARRSSGSSFSSVTISSAQRSRGARNNAFVGANRERVADELGNARRAFTDALDEV